MGSSQVTWTTSGSLDLYLHFLEFYLFDCGCAFERITAVNEIMQINSSIIYEWMAMFVSIFEFYLFWLNFGPVTVPVWNIKRFSVIKFRKQCAICFICSRFFHEYEMSLEPLRDGWIHFSNQYSDLSIKIIADITHRISWALSLSGTNTEYAESGLTHLFAKMNSLKSIISCFVNLFWQNTRTTTAIITVIFESIQHATRAQTQVRWSTVKKNSNNNNNNSR